MLPKELHNERFTVDLPVYHLLSRHNISFGLTNGGIVTGLSFLCQLLFTDFLLRPPFISLPLPFRSNGGIVGFCFFIPSKQICKSQISPPVRGFHTLIENPLDLTPDAMLQRGQPFQNFFKSVPLVNAHHKPVTWNINRLEELPFLLHCVEFNAIFVVEAVVVVLVAHQVFGKNPVLVFFLWRKDVLFLFIRSGIAGRKTGALQTVCNQLLDFFNTAMFLNETGQVLRLLERTELQSGFSFINGASMLKQVQAKLIADRLCFLGWQKSTFSKEIADSRMFLAHISPPHITAPAHARCHRPGAEQGTL